MRDMEALRHVKLSVILLLVCSPSMASPPPAQQLAQTLQIEALQEQLLARRFGAERLPIEGCRIFFPALASGAEDPKLDDLSLSARERTAPAVAELLSKIESLPEDSSWEKGWKQDLGAVAHALEFRTGSNWLAVFRLVDRLADESPPEKVRKLFPDLQGILMPYLIVHNKVQVSAAQQLVTRLSLFSPRDPDLRRLIVLSYLLDAPGMANSLASLQMATQGAATSSVFYQRLFELSKGPAQFGILENGLLRERDSRSPWQPTPAQRAAQVVFRKALRDTILSEPRTLTWGELRWAIDELLRNESSVTDDDREALLELQWRLSVMDGYAATIRGPKETGEALRRRVRNYLDNHARRN
jgi:hypothetical protein